MNEKIKIALGLTGLIAIVVIGCLFLFNSKGEEKQGFLPTTPETEAKHLLLMLRTHILVHHIETESYEGVDFSTLKALEDSEALVGVISTGEGDNEGYWLGNTNNQELIDKAKEVCPECRITKDGFKAIGLVYKDGKYSAKTITHEEGDVVDLDIP